MTGCGASSSSSDTVSETSGPVGSIVGTLYRNDGQVASDVTVKLYTEESLSVASLKRLSPASTMSPVATTVTDSQGAFSFTSLPYNSYTLVAEDTIRSAQGFYQIQLNSEQTTIGELQFLTNGTISGNVVLADSASPLAISVFIPGTTYYALTDTHGNFSLIVPEGTYDIYMMKVGYESQTQSDIHVTANSVTVLSDSSLAVDAAVGVTWYQGEGVPSLSLGEVGDFYLNTLTDIFYIKSESSWEAQGVLNGSNGADGEDGEDGDNGMDGDNAYVYIVYSDNSDGTEFDSTYTSQSYMGLLTTSNVYNSTSLESMDKTTFTWVLIKGSDGANGANGANGADGTSTYFYTVYSDSSEGVAFSTTYTDERYMGTLTTHNVYSTSGLEELDASVFTWVLIQGAGLDYIDVSSVDEIENTVTINVTLNVVGTIERISLYGSSDTAYEPVRLSHMSYSSSVVNYNMGPALYANFQVQVTREGGNTSLFSYRSVEAENSQYEDSSNMPIDMVYDDANTLYVLAFTGSSYVVIKTDSTLRSAFYDHTWTLTGAVNPTDIVWVDNTLYVLDKDKNEVFYFSDTESGSSVSTTFDGNTGGGTWFNAIHGIFVSESYVSVLDDGAIRLYSADFAIESTEINFPDGVTLNHVHAYADGEFVASTEENDLYYYAGSTWIQLDTYGEDLSDIGDVAGVIEDQSESRYVIVTHTSGHQVRLYYLYTDPPALYRVFKTGEDVVGAMDYIGIYSPTRLAVGANVWSFLRGDSLIPQTSFFKRVGIHINE